MTSRIPGFYHLTLSERLDKISETVDLSDEEKTTLLDKGLSVQQADQMIENVIGTFPIPLGIAVNFKVNGEDVFIPMATEEASVVAAASNAAKLTYQTGGFTTSTTGSIMRGQIQIINVKNPYHTLAKIYEKKEDIIQLCNEQDQTLVALGGGAKDIEVLVLEESKMVVVHVLVDTRDAMGANAVNTMLEAVAPLIEEISEAEVVLRILSNLADKRIVRARATFENPFNNKKDEVERFLSAYKLAMIDPYRAATHNKGIMNGISAVALATGNDTRAIEAGAHAYAASSGVYRSLSHWELGDDGHIIGTIELPLVVGIVGGATQTHPVAKLALKLMKIKSAEQLAGIIAATGLAQNFAALRALATDGIQKGHMKLHARNMALMAGAKMEQVDKVIQQAAEKETFNFDTMKEIVESQQN
ncbi:hydroxymethylglutaryl-CoA reductase, degradative [Pseudogracilibacillus auburnensis]|uniref:hydroxymethylglutaryl-CoA reductase, degradative n=1 Tax=Pseudogracilibacillus auburnensis TaxID=1494959 RepID=UPI001A963F0F|nr:hydroxymethylglutaryl-CoA reductase, degradative [Pseudogracilibacillus auburnensis]MBO1002816.1 hydroxymethylglutaryl-CoA reductase, degradative [Pseudogracilibacillus auburnensis]